MTRRDTGILGEPTVALGSEVPRSGQRSTVRLANARLDEDSFTNAASIDAIADRHHLDFDRLRHEDTAWSIASLEESDNRTWLEAHARQHPERQEAIDTGHAKAEAEHAAWRARIKTQG